MSTCQDRLRAHAFGLHGNRISLSPHRLTYYSAARKRVALPSVTSTLTDCLDNYNNGKFGVVHCN